MEAKDDNFQVESSGVIRKTWSVKQSGLNSPISGIIQTAYGYEKHFISAKSEKSSLVKVGNAYQGIDSIAI